MLQNETTMTFVRNAYSHEDVLIFRKGDKISISNSGLNHLKEASHHTLRVLHSVGNIAHRLTIESNMLNIKG